MPVPGAAIRAMPGDLGWLPARLPGAGPAVLAGELVGRVRAELPAVGELGEPEQVLVSAWLTGLRSALTCVPAPTGVLPRVELPEVILEVMSWAPPLVASFTAVSGGRSCLEDLPTSVAACLSVPLLLKGRRRQVA